MPPEQPAEQVLHLDWAQFGLAGLVIAALFTTLMFMFRSHQAERKEWREDITKMQDRSTQAVQGLERVSNELMIAVRELIYKSGK